MRPTKCQGPLVTMKNIFHNLIEKLKFYHKNEVTLFMPSLQMGQNILGPFCLVPNIRCVKGIVSDSNNIFLWHESEDINKKKLISKISVDSSVTFSSYT